MGRVRDAFSGLASWRLLLLGPLVWGLAMVASVGYGLHHLGRLTSANDILLLVLVFVGAALGFVAALPVTRILAGGRRPETVLAAAMLALTLATLGFTIALFALQYRHFYAQWHGAMFSRRWFLEFLGTTAGAVIQFAVLGIRLYLPFGLFFLGLGSFWLARRVRSDYRNRS